MIVDRAAVLRWLETQVPPPRLRHILSVEAWGQQLATYHGLDAERVATAGLLHDLAKYYPDERLLAIARATPEIVLDPILEAVPHLLHGPVSAVVAQQTFGVNDPIVLNAVRYHTLGDPALDPVAQVVFVADALEPYRGQTARLQHLRQLATENLAAAVVAVSNDTLGLLLARDQLIHPRLLDTRNTFLTYLGRCTLVK